MQTHKCKQCLRNNKMCIIVSIQNKHIDCFKEACKNIDANDANDIYANDVCTYATLCGSVEFLKYAHENGYQLDPYALNHAIVVRNIDCLKYAHEHGAVIQRDILQSLYSRADDITNLFEIIKYMYEHVKRENFDDEVITKVMAKFGRIDILKYLYEQNVPFHPLTLDNNWIVYIYSDNMKCLRFAILAGAPTNYCFRALVIKTNLRLACLRIKKRRTQRLASIALNIFNRQYNPDYREIGKLVATHIINTSH